MARSEMHLKCLGYHWESLFPRATPIKKKFMAITVKKAKYPKPISAIAIFFRIVFFQKKIEIKSAPKWMMEMLNAAQKERRFGTVWSLSCACTPKRKIIT